MKILLTALAAVGLLTGCNVLSPIEDDPTLHLLEAAVPPRTLSSGSPVVGVSRPSLPPYLDRQQLVTRQADGQLRRHESHLWAEPIDASISRVLAENLRRLTGSTGIQPAENFISREYGVLVEIRVDRFDPDADGSLRFECTWKVQPVSGGDVSTREYRTSVPLDPELLPQTARVRAMNEALARLAREIVRAL